MGAGAGPPELGPGGAEGFRGPGEGAGGVPGLRLVRPPVTMTAASRP